MSQDWNTVTDWKRPVLGVILIIIASYVVMQIGAEPRSDDAPQVTGMTIVKPDKFGTVQSWSYNEELDKWIVKDEKGNELYADDKPQINPVKQKDGSVKSIAFITFNGKEYMRDYEGKSAASAAPPPENKMIETQTGQKIMKSDYQCFSGSAECSNEPIDKNDPSRGYTILDSNGNPTKTVDLKKGEIKTNFINYNGEPIPKSVTDMKGNTKETSEVVDKQLFTTTYNPQNGEATGRVMTDEDGNPHNMKPQHSTADDPSNDYEDTDIKITYWIFTDGDNEKFNDKAEKDADKRAKAMADFIGAMVADGYKDIDWKGSQVDPATGATQIQFKDDKHTDTLIMTPSTNSWENMEYTFTLKDGTKGTVIEGGWFADDIYKINDKSYTVSDKCKHSKYCLKNGGEKSISEGLYNSLDNLREMNKNRNELCNAQTGKDCADINQNYAKYYSKLEGILGGKIRSLMNSYLEEALGPFFREGQAEICNLFTGTDYSYDQEVEDSETTILGMTYPKTTYTLDMETEILEDIRTVIITGAVTEITTKMYRYEVRRKMIGDKDSGKWELWFRNSCDDTISKDFWYDYGSIGYGSHEDVLYAGQAGEDMVFECGVDPYCKFNQVAFKWDDKDVQYFNLDNGHSC